MRNAHSLQRRIGELMRAGKKNSRLADYTGCSNEQLREHIESQFTDGMSWENYGCGKGRWQVDHIRQKVSFNLADDAELRRCFHFSNLRPLWSAQNAAYVRSEQTLTKMRAAAAHTRKHPSVDRKRAQSVGLTVNAVKLRIRAGTPEEFWYAPRGLRMRKYDHDRAAAAGISIKTVKSRAKRGWPEERWYEPIAQRPANG